MERPLPTTVDVLAGMKELHARGIAAVVVTSCQASDTPAGHIAVLGSRSSERPFQLLVPLLDAQFFGTGDLMAALLLAWTWTYPADFGMATERAVAGVQAVLRRTVAAYEAAVASRVPGADDDRAFQRRALELRLVDSRADLEQPPVLQSARWLDWPDAA